MDIKPEINACLPGMLESSGKDRGCAHIPHVQKVFERLLLLMFFLFPLQMSHEFFTFPHFLSFFPVLCSTLL